MAIKAILFDLDNTLIDFMRMKRESCAAAVEAMIGAGLKLDREEATRILFKLYDQYGIEYPKIFQEFLLKTAGRIDYRLLAEAVIAYRRIQTSYIKAYPNVVPTLMKLREQGLKLGIVSDAPSVNAWLRLVELRIPDFFDIVVTFDDTGEHKPSPLPFKKALDALGFRPEEILFIGDWPERDIVGAKQMGMQTVFARYGYQKTPMPARGEGGADYEIEDIGELVMIVA